MSDLPPSDRLPVPYADRNLPAASRSTRRDEDSLRSLICHVGRLMHDARYQEGMSGSISARLDAAHILITPAMLAKGFLQPEHLLVYDLEAEQPPELAADPALQGELAIHMECYRQRPDVAGVIHAHPPTAVALTLAGVSMRSCVVPEAIIVLGLVPTAAASAPGSSEQREAVRVLIAQHDAILLAHHGAVTVGADLWQAYLKLEILEHTATILHRAAQLGPIPPLPPEQVAPLLDLRRRLGYWRSGDEDRFCEMCGVC